MIIRNKHNFTPEKVKSINNHLMASWFADIYGRNEIFKNDGMNLNNVKKGEFENNTLFMEDLVRAMKKVMNDKDFKESVFEITFIDRASNFKNIHVLATKFVLKDGVLMKFVGDVENIPFSRI